MKLRHGLLAAALLALGCGGDALPTSRDAGGDKLPDLSVAALPDLTIEAPPPDLTIDATTCPMNTVLCDGSCISVDQDRNNCGSCGHVCPGGFDCSGGQCQCTTVNCGGICCGPNSVCLKGQICQACGGNQVVCNGNCTDLTSDSNNCNKCGMVCPNGTTCMAGACTACPMKFCDKLQTCVAGICTCGQGQTLCGQICADLSFDINNCGMCGHACGPKAGACANGMCFCANGGTLCNGTCVDLTSDSNNCSGCGMVCGQNQICVNSVCGQCPNNQSVCNGRCTDLSSDISNCGLCSNFCNKGQQCMNGVCK